MQIKSSLFFVCNTQNMYYTLFRKGVQNENLDTKTMAEIDFAGNTLFVVKI
jgi:hypothetical protein